MADLRLLVDVVTKGQENLKSLEGELAKTNQSATALKKGLAFGGGFVAALGLKEGVEFLGEAVNKAAEFEDTVSAAGVIMGQEAVPALEEWAESAASAFGASEQLALKSANQMAVFGKSAGLVGDDLRGFATDMTQLGGDLASFFGGSTEEAITAIGAALRGESEPIRRYGVLLDDATLRQRAFAMGLVSTTKNALTPQVRVLAAQAEILAQTTDAQGDFQRTSEGMANTQRELGAEFENLQIEIGQQLLPIMVELAHFVRDALIPGLEWLGQNVIGPIVRGFGVLADAIAPVVSAIGTVVDVISDAGSIVGDFAGGFDKSAKPVKDFGKNVEDSMTQVHNAVVENLGGTAGAVQESFEQIAQIPIDEIEARWQDVRSAAFETTIQYQLGILDGQNQVKSGFEVLTRLQEEEQTKAQRIAYLKGQLTSAQLASGLKDPRSGVSAASRALRGQIIAELASLGVNAYNSGLSVPRNLAAGMYRDAHLLDGASSYLAAKISGYLPRSNAETGPLSDIEDVGGRIVSSITDGIYHDIGGALRASDALASALALGPLGTSTAGDGATGRPGASSALSGPVVNINLTVEGSGVDRDEYTLADAIRRMVLTSGMGELQTVLGQ